MAVPKPHLRPGETDEQIQIYPAVEVTARASRHQNPVVAPELRRRHGAGGDQVMRQATHLRLLEGHASSTRVFALKSKTVLVLRHPTKIGQATTQCAQRQACRSRAFLLRQRLLRALNFILLTPSHDCSSVLPPTPSSTIMAQREQKQNMKLVGDCGSLPAFSALPQKRSLLRNVSPGHRS
jgi:hypothetical protein